MQRWLDGDMRIIILIQQRELFLKIRTKKRRTGNRRGVAARVGKTAIGAGFRGICGAAVPGDTKRRVNKKTIMAGCYVREYPCFNILTNGASQCFNRLLVQRVQFIQCLSRCQAGALIDHVCLLVPQMYCTPDSMSQEYETKVRR